MNNLFSSLTFPDLNPVGLGSKVSGSEEERTLQNGRLDLQTDLEKVTQSFYMKDPRLSSGQ